MCAWVRKKVAKSWRFAAENAHAVWRNFHVVTMQIYAIQLLEYLSLAGSRRVLRLHWWCLCRAWWFRDAGVRSVIVSTLFYLPGKDWQPPISQEPLGYVFCVCLFQFWCWDGTSVRHLYKHNRSGNMQWTAWLWLRDVGSSLPAFKFCGVS